MSLNSDKKTPFTQAFEISPVQSRHYPTVSPVLIRYPVGLVMGLTKMKK
jgi:hypothetical protein